MRKENSAVNNEQSRNRAISKRVLFLAAMVILLVRLEARSQSDPRKLEVGGQFVGLSAHSPALPKGFINDIDDTVYGGGARAGYNFSKHWSADVEINVFQRPPTSDPATRGRWVQGLFGVKATKRRERIGVFLKARPGFMRFDGVAALFTDSNGKLQVGLIFDNTYFALDLGGGVELYPTRRTIVRFDAGDLLIRYTNRPPSDFDPVSNARRRVSVGNNFQFEAGFGFRF